jgi:hypothetical protein
MDKFAFYYEVEHDTGDGNTNKEGGFLMAHDHKDAMDQLIAIYEPGLLSAHIEYMEKEIFVFPLNEARIAKDWVNANGSY